MSSSRPFRPKPARSVLWLLLAAPGVTALVACGGGSAARAPGTRPPAVEAVPARSGALPMVEELSGVVRAANQVTVRPEISGTVVEVSVRNGDAVTVGQTLVRLDDSVLREQLRRAVADHRLAMASAAEARARVAEVQARVVRTRALATSGLASQLELETLEAQLNAAEAGADQAEAAVEEAAATVDERRSALAKATVRAPVSGLVGQREAEVGMTVSSATSLLVLGDHDELIVEAPLTQEMLRHVGVGAPVQIGIRGGDRNPITAEISRISPFLESRTFSTTAEIDVTGVDNDLRPGMFVTVRVLYGATEAATLLPASALWEDPLSGDWSVFVVDGTGLTEPEIHGGEIADTPRSVVQRPVELLADNDGRAGVTGVEPEEWVVILGQHLLQEQLEVGDGETVTARVRPTTWQHVLSLEQLQREDLLERFMAKQRAVAHVLGADLPESPAAVDAALEAAGLTPTVASNNGSS